MYTFKEVLVIVVNEKNFLKVFVNDFFFSEGNDEIIKFTDIFNKICLY